jgi:hypothetical protein
MEENKLNLELLSQDFADALVSYSRPKNYFGAITRIVLHNAGPDFSEMPRLVRGRLSARAGRLEGEDRNRLLTLCNVPVAIINNGDYNPAEGDYVFDVARIAEIYKHGGRLAI